MFKTFFFLLTAAGGAMSADFPLTSLIPEDSGSVVGFDAGRMLGSPFGRRILSRMQAADPRLKILFSLGFDPAKDLKQVVVVTGVEGRNSLVLVDGKFQSKQLLQGLAAGLITGGAKKSAYEGVEVMTSGDGNALAFPDESTMLLGNEALLRTVIGRRKMARKSDAPLLAKAGRWMASHDLWFASAGPTNDFTGSIGERATGGVLSGAILKSLDRTYGGLRFTDSVEVGVETAARTERDAQSMVKVMRLLSALGAMTKGATSGPLGFLDTLDIKAEGNLVNFKLTIPKKAFDSMSPEADAL